MICFSRTQCTILQQGWNDVNIFGKGKNGRYMITAIWGFNGRAVTRALRNEHVLLLPGCRFPVCFPWLWVLLSPESLLCLYPLWLLKGSVRALLPHGRWGAQGLFCFQNSPLSKIVWLFAYKMRTPLSHFLINLIPVRLMVQEPPSWLTLITWNLSVFMGQPEPGPFLFQLRGCTGTTLICSDVLTGAQCPKSWLDPCLEAEFWLACSKYFSILSFLLFGDGKEVLSFNPTSSRISGFYSFYFHLQGGQCFSCLYQFARVAIAK